MPELKPCPFCGGNPCKTESTKKPTQDESVAHWVYNSFGPEIAKSLTSPQDGLWTFETDSK